MKGGDATDLEKLYRVYFMRVFSYMMTLAKDADIAEELTQQTFFKAMSGSYRGEADELTYLCAIAKNLFYDEMRRNKRFTAKSEEHSADIPDKVSDPQTAAEEKDAVLQIHLAVHALSEPYKEVFSLRVFGELSFSQIAKIFGKTESWARVTYHRARLKIKERIRYEDNV